jgi:hypothetical protein
MKTVFPLHNLTFNEWAAYIRNEVVKIKLKKQNEGKDIR